MQCVLGKTCRILCTVYCVLCGRPAGGRMKPKPSPSPLPVLNAEAPCWHRIGVWGDRSCPELAKVTHCHNCPVFAAAGRRFLDGPSPPDYLDEWTERLARP